MQKEILDKILSYHNIAILGFGREGRSTYDFIRKYNKEVTLTILDQNKIIIDDNNVICKTYNNQIEELLDYDLIIKSPGISFKNLDVSLIQNKITSQIELLLEVNRKNMIGVTGTKGKSTTVSLIYQIFKDQNKKVFLVGNIGVPVLDNIDDYDDAIIVTEMSSHQLEFVNYSPHIGIILNLFEDHLDHAGSVYHYHECKMHMVDYLTDDDYGIIDLDNEALKNQMSVVNKENILTVSLNEEANAYIKDNTIYIGNEVIKKEDVITSLQGEHNLKNIMFALLVAKIYKLDLNLALESIKKFKPLEHRMELVGTYNNITFYDDAIATIPEATINACKSLKMVNTLIFGGMDRGIDYTKLIDYLKNSDIEHFICMPTTGYQLSEHLPSEKVYKVETLDEAVELSFNITKKNTICLLSPAASSYEQFKNFEEKGNYYKELIKNYKKD